MLSHNRSKDQRVLKNMTHLETLNSGVWLGSIETKDREMVPKIKNK